MIHFERQSVILTWDDVTVQNYKYKSAPSATYSPSREKRTHNVFTYAVSFVSFITKQAFEHDTVEHHQSVQYQSSALQLEAQFA